MGGGSKKRDVELQNRKRGEERDFDGSKTGRVGERDSVPPKERRG